MFELPKRRDSSACRGDHAASSSAVELAARSSVNGPPASLLQTRAGATHQPQPDVSSLGGLIAGTIGAGQLRAGARHRGSEAAPSRETTYPPTSSPELPRRLG